MASEFSTIKMLDYLSRFQSVVQNHIQDSHFKITLNSAWSSSQAESRIKIRHHMADVDTSYFNRLQWAQLYDLNQRPTSDQGFLSISHCHLLGGYSFSSFQHGFDIEEISRISDPIIIRTTSEKERSTTPYLKLLWVAKESAYKGMGENQPNVITELTCSNWESTGDKDIYSFQISSTKPANHKRNLGFVMNASSVLLSVYFF